MRRHITGVLFALTLLPGAIALSTSAAQAEGLIRSSQDSLLITDRRDRNDRDDRIFDRNDRIFDRRDVPDEVENRRESCDHDDSQRRDDHIGSRINLCERERTDRDDDLGDDLDDVWDDIRDLWD